jgi:transglutaminase-like putative cysteine protease
MRFNKIARTAAVAAAWISVCGGVGGLVMPSPASAQQPPAPPHLSDVRLDDALAGKSAQLVLIKDWIKIENTGALIRDLQFDRYSAAIDDEQVQLGRWVRARTVGGTELPADVAAVSPDPAGNLVQRIRVRPMPPRMRATVEVTTLVARRERPTPAGPFPIPALEQYPEAVRLYLAASAMVAVDDAYVRTVAQEILAKTHDAYEVAAEVAKMAKARSYLPQKGAVRAASLAASVLKNGGSCCASAVAAAAVLRACGIPAQVTYCPAGYIHGIVRFWLQGYGWVRMDATSGTGTLPLLQSKDELGLARLFDTPIRMEAIDWAYAWPYEHNDLEGKLPFYVDGQPSEQVKMADSDEGLPWVQDPFPHLEPGSWNTVLGSEDIAKFCDWDSLVKASREAVLAARVGSFQELVDRVGAAKYAEAAETWAEPK